MLCDFPKGVIYRGSKEPFYSLGFFFGLNKINTRWPNTFQGVIHKITYSFIHSNAFTEERLCGW